MPIHSMMPVPPCSITLNLACKQNDQNSDLFTESILTSVINSAICIAVCVCNVNGRIHLIRLVPFANAMNIINISSTWVSTQLCEFKQSSNSCAAFRPVSNGFSRREPSAEPPKKQFVVVWQPILITNTKKNIYSDSRFAS